MDANPGSPVRRKYASAGLFSDLPSLWHPLLKLPQTAGCVLRVAFNYPFGPCPGSRSLTMTGSSTWPLRAVWRMKRMVVRASS
ncbi:hypothetical protein DSECCO2_331360 [anaerobic digester metagenome]